MSNGSVMDAPASGVSVRMYRQGFGDCFLLTFQTPARPWRMLIDCGLLRNVPEEAKTMQEVVADIKAACADGPHGESAIDVLVITHEHWDHLCGFRHGRQIFENEIAFGEVWLAWTEDPKDKLAIQIRNNRKAVERRLKKAAERQLAIRAASGPGQPPGALSALMEFAVSTEDMFDTAKALAKPIYLEPGDVRTASALPDVRFYVLGPPKSHLLFKDKPFKGGGEVYELTEFARMQDESVMNAAEFGDRPVDDLGNEAQANNWRQVAPYQPFDYYERVDYAQAKRKAKQAGGETVEAFVRANYGFENDKGDGPAWRRIDDDWLESAGGMALALASQTNNTSLVLAIELVKSDKVLLFVGDAQAGSWASFADVKTFKASPRRDSDPHAPYSTVDELLSRIALYKVGHHGSHNATASISGLEKMGRDFIALVPTSKRMAMGEGWKRIPFTPLMKRLREKTGGHIIRSDTGVDDDWNPPKEMVKHGPKDLYIDVTIADKE